MKPEDFKKLPKTFCENISVAFTPEFFLMGLNTGEQNSIYTLTPQHMKRLQQYLVHQVTEFEKANGEIKASWNPNIVSPLQPNLPNSSV